MHSSPQQLLIIGYVWPEPTSTGASVRMMEWVDLFLQHGWLITYASAAAPSEHMADLSLMGVQCTPIEVNSSSFDHFIHALQPNIVLFDRYLMEEQFGWRVEKTCPHALRVIETIDLHCLREARHTALKQGLDFDQLDLFTETAQREIASIYRSDISVLISDFEMDLLVNHFKMDASLLHVCPFMLGMHTLPENLPNFEARQHCMSIGNFRHAPNWDAVLWLKQNIWPLIRQQLPQAQMHIYGAYTPPKATALHNTKAGFLIKHRADDVHEVMQQARVCVAPLRFGAGIKTKLADAMRNGTPSVTTSIGAEGMSYGLPWGGAICDEPQAFADAVVKLYQDKPAWLQAQQAGFTILQSVFDKKKNGDALMQKITHTQENLAKHRQQNFMGSMLRYHANRSTEFMSRWIEAKNSLTPP